jgi:uncharacterized coiled-coil protein SlyX
VVVNGDNFTNNSTGTITIRRAGNNGILLFLSGSSFTNHGQITVEEAGMAWKPKRVRSRPVDDRVSELEQRLSKFDHQLGELSSLLTMTSEHLDSQLALLRGAVTVVAEHINIAPSRTGLAATNANKTCLAGSKV